MHSTISGKQIWLFFICLVDLFNLQFMLKKETVNWTIWQTPNKRRLHWIYGIITILHQYVRSTIQSKLNGLRCIKHHYFFLLPIPVWMKQQWTLFFQFIIFYASNVLQWSRRFHSGTFVIIFSRFLFILQCAYSQRVRTPCSKNTMTKSEK